MKVVVTGASGKLGTYLVEEARLRGWTVQPWGHGAPGDDLMRIDLRSTEAVLRQLDSFQADYILHTAALSTVAECFRDPDLAHQVNAEASRVLARWCARNGAGMVYLSTDMVFDGEEAPYGERAPVSPCTAYGRSKVAGEDAVLDACPEALVVRVGLMCGVSRSHRRSFFDSMLDCLRQQENVRAFEDEWRTPIYVGDAAWALCELSALACTGTVHLGGQERLSRFDMCQQMAGLLTVPVHLIHPMSRLEGGFDEPRQRDLSLRSERLQDLLPGFEPRPFAQSFEI